MNRLQIVKPSKAQAVVETLYKDLENRVANGPTDICPVDMAISYLRLCFTQTCGKCVPCRVGLAQLEEILLEVQEGTALPSDIDLIESTARMVQDTADCTIGISAAQMVRKSVAAFREDYIEHITKKRCLCDSRRPVPCVSYCPANVDVPGYIALALEGRFEDAVRLIRQDNPFPIACAFVCEHPCELRCRRNMVDDAINIRGIKRYAVDKAGKVSPPVCAQATGKKVAVLGGGPSGLSTAYFLSLMGHSVTVYEKREKAGGMLRYGIPSYRFPRERLDEEIETLQETGFEIKTGVEVGVDITMETLREQYDAIYVSIGAHTDKKLGIEGEDKRGVISAVEMLRRIGDGNTIDMKGKKVCIIGGGNVAMDATRTAKRLGAEQVTCVYRRRIEDMTALYEEIEGAIAEGCEIVPLMAPVRIEGNGTDVTALWVQPQMISEYDKNGRPRPQKADKEEVRIEADVIIIAIGQDIEHEYFGKVGFKIEWGNIAANNTCVASCKDEGVFAGGDCVSGPATVILAIEAGKVAAANIDSYLGYDHKITAGIDIPNVRITDTRACGRVNMAMREAQNRKNDFMSIENCMSDEEAMQEAGRCLRCDHFGYGGFKGGRTREW